MKISNSQANRKKLLPSEKEYRYLNKNEEEKKEGSMKQRKVTETFNIVLIVIEKRGGPI